MQTRDLDHTKILISPRAEEYDSLVGEHLNGGISIDHDDQALNSNSSRVLVWNWLSINSKN
jgi:hypothetical protein